MTISCRAITYGWGPEISPAYSLRFIGNNRKSRHAQLPSCSISHLLIAYTQQFDIFVIALIHIS